MRRYRYDAQTMDGWKSYPIRLEVPGLSSCHRNPRVLVQSMPGRFVTANCTECRERETLSLAEFVGLLLYVACPQCRKKMKAGYVPDSSKIERNYGFRCDACKLYIWLSDLLPYWDNVA